MIYILLPLQKEGEKVVEIINKLRRELSHAQHKIIAIIDGRDDVTLEKLRILEGDDLIIRSHRIRMGMGATMATGFITAVLDSDEDNDYIVTMESGQVNSPNLLRDLLRGLDEGNDIRSKMAIEIFHLNENYLAAALII